MMNKLFFLFATVLVALGFGSCSDDDSEMKSLVIDVATPTIGTGAKVDNPSSMPFTMNLSGVQQIAYEVTEAGQAAKARNSQDENAAGALIFKNALLEGGSGIIDAVEGENTVVVKNLEGNKSYTVRFAFKTGENTYSVKSQDFTTPGYNKLVTILGVTTEGFKVHVDMPEGKYWRWGYTTADMYYQMEQFGTDDISRLEYNGGLFEQGPKTLEIKNGEVWYTIKEEIYDDNYEEVIDVVETPEYHAIYPGYSYIFLIGECDETGAMEYGYVEGGDDFGGWGPLSVEEPNIVSYTEEWTSDYLTFDGKYAKVQFDVAAPALQPSELTIEAVKQNERRAVYNIVPGPNTKQYAVTILDQDTYEMLKSWTGENALKWVALNYNYGVYTDAQQIEVAPLDSNSSYKMFVYGSYSDDSMLMSFEEITVTSTPSDKPDAKLIVTPLTKEQMEAKGEDPVYMVGYNVKCAEGNCAGVKYVANFANLWDELLSYGMTDEDVLDQNGWDVFESDDAEFIKGINSAEGYDMMFSSTEKTEMVLGIAAYNVDEKMSEAVFSRTTSAEEWGKNPIDSPLFTELAGDWTATYKYERHFMDENWEAQKETHEKTFKMTITDGFDQGPETMDAETYNSLVNYYVENGDEEEVAKAKVEDNFADFKEKAKHYSAKHRSLNRMIVTGFEPLHAYKSAWDLAVDLNHSAVDNDDLFYDFGPKMFLQITENGVTLNSALDKYPPVSAWYKSENNYYPTEYYLLGCNGEDYISTVAFPVEISDDKQTLTIKAMDGGYYPSVGYTMYGWEYGASFEALGLSEIVLTKGWNGTEEPAAVAPKHYNKQQNISPRRGANRFVKTKLPLSKKAVTILGKTTIDPAVAGKKVIKDMKKREKMIQKLKK